jgi:hypothetical protein
MHFRPSLFLLLSSKLRKFEEANEGGGSVGVAAKFFSGFWGIMSIVFEIVIRL